MRHSGALLLISILKSATELDRLDELRNAAMECYALAIRSVSQYTVEVSPFQIAEFRLHLKGIERQWQTAQGAEAMRAVQASFRGELREYRDQAREQLTRLRKELEGAAAAMASFADEITSHNSDHEEELKRELNRLEKAGASSDLQQIREGIRVALGEISVSLDQMRRGNQLTVAQLQDEIRLLHQEFQAERRALFTDQASGAWTRQKVDLKIHELLRQDDRFCIVAIALQNLPQIEADHSRTLVEMTLKSLLMRLRNALGDDTLVGRWNEHEFVAILDLDPAALNGVADGLARKLEGSYAVQENGLVHDVVVELIGGWVEHAKGSDPASFIRKLERMTNAILPGSVRMR